MKKFILIIVLILSILTLIPVITQGNDDVVFFFSPNADDIPTDIVFRGEIELDLKVIFSQDCSDWSVEMNSDLFNTRIIGIHRESLPEGKIKNYGLGVNQNAPFGNYSIPVYLNYSDVSGRRINNIFNFTLEYTEAYRITEVTLPTKETKEFVIIIETYVELSELHVSFDSDGDIGISNNSFLLSDPFVGTYPFSTFVFKEQTGSGNQEVGYHVIGNFNGREIESIESNIIVSVEWKEDEQDNSPYSNYLIIAVLILFLICFNYYIFIHRKKS